MNTPKKTRPALRRRLIAVSGFLFASLLIPQASAADLISNGDFESATTNPTWPDGWSPSKSGSSSYEVEDGHHFLRINATVPGETIIIYRSVPIPVGVKAVELNIRARVIGLQTGNQPWFDARILCDFKNVAGAKLKGAKPIAFRSDTNGWVERKVRFAVPEGAMSIDIMPSLFQVYTGTFDLDEVQLRDIEISELSAP